MAPDRPRVGPGFDALSPAANNSARHRGKYAGESAKLAARSAEVKPGVKMPNFKLTDEQLSELVAYFRDAEMNDSPIHRSSRFWIRISGRIGNWRGSRPSITSASAFSTC
jgi:hypothetical protein